MPVAPAAAAAFGYDGLLAVMAQVGNDLTRFFVFYDRPQGNRNEQVFGVAAVAVRPLTLAARLGLEQAAEAEVDEGVDIAVGYEDDVAAVTAVAAVRTALGDKFFAAEAAHAVAAFSGLHKNSGSIDKHNSPH